MSKISEDLVKFESKIVSLKNRIIRLERELNKCGRAETVTQVKAIVGRALRKRSYPRNRGE